MPTVTPYPTLTLFPTSNATPVLQLSPMLNMIASDQLGPRAVQWWQMYITPGWETISAGLLLIMVIILGIEFIYLFKEL